MFSKHLTLLKAVLFNHYLLINYLLTNSLLRCPPPPSSKLLSD